LQESIQHTHSASTSNIQQVFERWEGQVVSAEYDTPSLPTDTLQDSFEQEEEALALKMLLDELSETNQQSNDNQ
jgi:phage shock protein A